MVLAVGMLPFALTSHNGATLIAVLAALALIVSGVMSTPKRGE